jgi:DNA-binding response OmpR family regulator
MPKVLIIDDDFEFASELGDILIGEGYDVNISNDGEKSLRMIDNFPFDIIVVDYKMPGINGIDLISILNSKKIETRIVLISGSLNIETLLEEKGLTSAVSLVMSKPFVIDDLLGGFKSLLSQ